MPGLVESPRARGVRMMTDPSLEIVRVEPERPHLITVDRWPCLICRTMVPLARTRRTVVSYRDVDTLQVTEREGLVCLECLHAHGRSGKRPEPGGGAPDERAGPGGPPPAS